MINIVRANDPVIQKASRMVYLVETIKRLKNENWALKIEHAAMSDKYIPLLGEKYKYSKLARKLGKKLHRQYKRNKKHYAWLLRKYLALKSEVKR